MWKCRRVRVKGRLVKSRRVQLIPRTQQMVDNLQRQVRSARPGYGSAGVCEFCCQGNETGRVRRPSLCWTWLDPVTRVGGRMDTAQGTWLQTCRVLGHEWRARVISSTALLQTSAACCVANCVMTWRVAVHIV